jgi:heme exporter protein C
MAIIGLINVPIVKFSVDIWYSLHQPASILRSGGPAIDQTMLKPLFIMFLGYILYSALVLLLGTRVIIEKQKQQNIGER